MVGRERRAVSDHGHQSYPVYPKPKRDDDSFVAAIYREARKSIADWIRMERFVARLRGGRVTRTAKPPDEA